MNKMFIVKYPASVDNENLVPIGTLRIKHYKVDNPTSSSQYFVCYLSSPSQITVSKGLEILSSDLKTSKGTSVIGNTGEAAISNGDGYIDINDKYSLTILTLGSSYELNLSDIKYSTELTTLHLGNAKVTGTLSDLVNLTKLSRLILTNVPITGTWENFIEKQRSKGRTSGSINGYWTFGETTLNGKTISSNTPSGSITISWNSDSITLEGTTNDGTFNV